MQQVLSFSCDAPGASAEIAAASQFLHPKVGPDQKKSRPAFFLRAHGGKCRIWVPVGCRSIKSPGILPWDLGTQTGYLVTVPGIK